MIEPKPKRNLIVTAARAIPQKRLELFWEVARLRPEYEFIMILTKDPNLPEYSLRLSELTPSNGKIIFNPAKEAYQDILGKAKVYVHLMENEHFGITIVESMSASCVPIVHDSGGPKEIVSEKIGFLWRNILEVPDMIDQAMKISPSSFASEKAHAFSSEIFGNRLSAIFSELQGRNPRSSL